MSFYQSKGQNYESSLQITTKRLRCKTPRVYWASSNILKLSLAEIDKLCVELSMLHSFKSLFHLHKLFFTADVKPKIYPPDEYRGLKPTRN